MVGPARRNDDGGHTNVGGIAGVNAGGLVGYIKQSGTTVQNCYSAVTLRP